jgi:hypothetical protein
VQSLHLNSVFAVARKLGWYDETKVLVKHIEFGVVLGEDGLGSCTFICNHVDILVQ